MIKMNLLKNYNLSLSEIYQRKDIPDDDEEELSASSLALEWVSAFIKTFVMATIMFSIIAVAIILILDPFYRSPIRAIRASIRQDEPLQPALTPNAPRYVQIQVINFARSGTNVDEEPDIEKLSVIASIPIVSNSSSVPPPPPQVAPLPNKPLKRIPPPPPPPKKVIPPYSGPYTYSVSLANATTDEYELMRELANYNNVNIEAMETWVGSVPYWTLYTPDENSAIVVDSKRVKLLGKFRKQEQASLFATRYGTATPIIVQEDRNMRLVSTRVCCMPIDKAKEFARMTGIDDKLFTITQLRAKEDDKR
ncbi:hypothetical protein RsTz2092_04750 [Deferribacterales bacterium RsTz2092]|nr:hypothetical protein AGMMS49941_02620 [Deferribacterales bacterium]